MLVMEKSVDDDKPPDFVGGGDGAGFSGWWVSMETGFASAATEAGGDCDVGRTISTSNGDVGRLGCLLDAVVIACSSAESQQTADCIAGNELLPKKQRSEDLRLSVIVKEIGGNDTEKCVCRGHRSTNGRDSISAACLYLCSDAAGRAAAASVFCHQAAAAPEGDMSLSVNAPPRRSIGRRPLSGRCSVAGA